MDCFDGQESSENAMQHNQLIIDWLIEWREQAKRFGSKMEFVYGKALNSLRSHTDPIRSGEDCRKLKGFGNAICMKIDQKFAQKFPNSQNVTSQMVKKSTQMTDHFSVTATKPSAARERVSKNNRKSNYIPAKGSSAFAILIALLRLEMEFNNSKVNKLDLKETAQHYCKANFGLMTINSLLQRSLIIKTEERNCRYSLSDQGRELAKTLALASENLKDFADRYLKIVKPIDNPLNEKENLIERQDSIEAIANDSFVMEAGTYDIVLCIDSRERYSTNQGNQNRAAFASALQRKDINVEIRTLPVGDFVWIAKKKSSNATDLIRRELVLDYIIERKRIDDLASSIKDSRWQEQKFRLLNSGLRRPIYLIEYFGRQSRKQDHGSMNAASLDQAISNCEIDGFEIKRTDNIDETVRYLATMTKWLQAFYANKSILAARNHKEFSRTSAQDLCYMTFNEFCSNSSKVQIFTAKEMFIKHLLQIKGLSLSKAMCIIERYPTIRSLLDRYDSIDHKNEKLRNNLLSDIRCDAAIGSNRRLGPVISKRICSFYS
ncbi:Crossover junction endonuclease MUS81 [Sarcoptes scabiei]|uniref:Crossover junction endonuclease MUS81 n=1 Tax=Sarcoptes scabiei TaxID=52283 RepID=A0A834R6N1_SARSC|nr:Crossover junction endonuclease MUS81 [Sarcoptes scabiei]UXI16604.1 zinc finger protein [Sarcoptes scabiei]